MSTVQVNLFRQLLNEDGWTLESVGLVPVTAITVARDDAIILDNSIRGLNAAKDWASYLSYTSGKADLEGILSWRLLNALLECMWGLGEYDTGDGRPGIRYTPSTAPLQHVVVIDDRPMLSNGKAVHSVRNAVSTELTIEAPRNEAIQWSVLIQGAYQYAFPEYTQAVWADEEGGEAQWGWTENTLWHWGPWAINPSAGSDLGEGVFLGWKTKLELDGVELPVTKLKIGFVREPLAVYAYQAFQYRTLGQNPLVTYVGPLGTTIEFTTPIIDEALLERYMSWDEVPVTITFWPYDDVSFGEARIDFGRVTLCDTSPDLERSGVAATMTFHCRVLYNGSVNDTATAKLYYGTA